VKAEIDGSRPDSKQRPPRGSNIDSAIDSLKKAKGANKGQRLKRIKAALKNLWKIKPSK
jgi:hypothetical protein